MNETGINPVLTEHEVRELQLLIEQRSGIVFDESRERFLTSRVVEHMQRKRLTYGMELLRLVRNSNVEYDTMLERLLTQETRFLRYPGLFSAFEQHVLPEMQERKFWDKRPGCASGARAVPAAKSRTRSRLSICEAAACVRGGLDASIMATDISREALERADRGVYSRRVLENLSGPQIANYFTQQR